MGDSQSETRNEMLDSLLGDFLDESDQLLTQLSGNLLQLDEWVQSLGDDHGQRCDEGLLNEMFRAAHSLKGLSAMLGLTDINHLTHKIENVFDAARQDQLTVTRDVTELMFRGLDQLVAMVGLLKEPGSDVVDCDGVVEEIRRVLQDAGAEKKQATQADAELALGPAAGESPSANGPRRSSSIRPARNEPMGAGAPEHADPLQGIVNEEEIPAKYLSMFVDEAEASLDALTAGLLAREGGGSGEELQALVGIAHKIKGSAASVGLSRAAKLAHLMEDLLETLVTAGSPLSTPSTDLLLQCTDGLRQYVGELRRGVPKSDCFGQLACQLLAPPAGPPEPTRYAGEVTFEPGLATAGLKAQLIYEKLARLGSVDDCQPPLEQLDEVEQLSRFQFCVTTDQPRDAVAGQLRIAGVVEVTLEPASEPPARADEADARDKPGAAAVETRSDAETKQRPAAGSQRRAETVRVDTDRLDRLMDLAGQLAINRAQFSQIGEKLKTVVDCNHAAHALDRAAADLDRLGGRATFRVDAQHLASELEMVRGQVRRIRNDLEPLRREIQTLAHARDSVRDLFEAIHQLDRVSDGIQKGVMDIRMVPIGPLFARFHRVVRDIARSAGKQVRLEIAGEKTELDKRMVDELGEPLVHLVRNSADHGIEPPEERKRLGKPIQGTVTLNALHRGNNIVIEIRDDGKGLDTDRILRKALERGLVSELDAERMTARQIQQLIWEPGLSTAEKVTDISGRGMGMDIVKAKIEELNGTVDILSVQGRGTTITIKLPLTLAILPSLMVEIAGDVFALPMETVTEIVSVGAQEIRTVQGRQMTTVRGRVVSLARLGDALSFRRGAGRAEQSRPAETTLVIVGDAGQEIGLAVDRVIGEEDVVIKSISENYRNVAGIAGASILGDGRVALILDIPALVTAISMKSACIPC